MNNWLKYGFLTVFLLSLSVLLLMLFPVNPVPEKTVRVDGTIFKLGQMPEGKNYRGYTSSEGVVYIQKGVSKYFLPFVCRHEMVHVNGENHSEMSFVEYIGLKPNPKCGKLQKRL